MTLHAATTVDGRDRKRLERLARYLLRPPFAHDAVQWLPDGRVRLLLPRKHLHVDMTTDQFLAKLVELVPPPAFHMTRYAGVFANHHHLRPLIKPISNTPLPAPIQLPLFGPTGKPLVPRTPDSNPDPRSRIAWARLLARVFSIDIMTCPRCGGRMKMLPPVLDPDEIARLLHGARAPPLRPPPGQLSFFDA